MRYLILLPLLIVTALSAKPIAPPEFDTPQKRFFYFSLSGNLKGIDAALEEGADIDAYTYDRNSIANGYFTALHFSILREEDAVFEHLLLRGADVRVFSKFGNANALSLATIYGRRKMAVKLLDAGADPNAAKDDKSEKQYSAIAYAALYGNVDLLELYAAQGGDLERPLRWPIGRDLPPEFPLLSVAAQHGGLEVVRYLVEKRGHAINPRAKTPLLTPLSVAVRYDNMDVAKYLISRGADVNAVSCDASSFLSPLGVAARYGRHEMVKLLFAHGARVRENVEENEHPMYAANWAGYYRVIEAFEKEGQSFDYWTVLEREFQSEKGRKEKESLAVSASEFSPTFLKGHRRQWNIADESKLSQPLRLAMIADPQSMEVADLLTVALSDKQHIKLLERDALEAVLREQQLSSAGLTSGKSLSLVAGLLDAQALVLIETLQVNKEKIFQLRLVNSVLGLQFGRSFIEDDAAKLNASIEQYAASVGVLTNNFRRNYEKVIPLSLVNVRAGLGNLEGLKIESNLKHMLELELLAQPSVILTQREDLEALIREKDLGGREEEFKASGLFVDVGVELDASGTKPKRYTVRIQPAAGQSFTLELDAEANKPLSESASLICRAVMQSIAVDYKDSDQIQGGLLSKDAETYYNEALWHFNLEQYDACLESIRTAISLGYSKRDIWDYYCRANEILLSADRGHRGDDVNNRIKLDLLRERLTAIRGILKIYRSEVKAEELRAPLFGNYSRGRIDLWCIAEAFNHFRPVAMQRRYAEELEDIERQFLLLINEYLIPCFREPMPHGRYPFGNFVPEIFQIVDLMAQLDESEYEKALDGLMQACLERAAHVQAGRSDVWRTAGLRPFPPVSSPRWAELSLKYIDQEEARELSANLLAANYFGKFNYVSTPHRLGPRVQASILERKRTASRIAEAISSLSDKNNHSRRSDFTANLKKEAILGLPRLFRAAPYWGAIPLSFERIDVGLNFTFTSQRYEIWLIQKCVAENRLSSLPSGKAIQHRKSLELAFSKYKKGAEAGRIKANAKRIEEHIYGYEARLAKLSGKSFQDNSINLEELPIRLWSPQEGGFAEFVPGSRFLHPPVAAEDGWWVLAVVNRGSDTRLENPRYALLRINPETLETQARWFEQTITEKIYYNATYAKAGRWLALVKFGEPIMMIHLDTMETKEFPGYIPTKSPRTHFGIYVSSYGGRFFFFVQPESIGYGNLYGRTNSEMQILLRYDPETDEGEVVYNTRRNPPETMLDGTGSVFDLYGDSVGGFLVVSEDAHGPRYRVDCETLEIRKISRAESSKKKRVKASGFRNSTVLNNSYCWGLRRISAQQSDQLPTNNISMVLRTRVRDERGAVTKEIEKAVVPIPLKSDPLYARYVDLVREYEPQYIKNDSTKRRYWFAEDYGYLDYFTKDGDVLWGIFKMSDLAEALKNSPEL